MEDLVRLRNLLKGRLLRIQGTVNKHEAEAIPPQGLADLLAKVVDIDKQVDELQQKLVLVCKTEEVDLQTELGDWFIDKVSEVKHKIYKIQETFKKPDPAAEERKQNLVKLPRVDLPVFDGSYENWLSFQDLFKASVNNNTSLSGSQKLQYLKCCVKGEAANLIKAFTITDQNYCEAWDLLTNRYDNKREIVQSIMCRLFSQQAMKNESSSCLQNLLDISNECIRSLRVLGRPIDTCDDFLVYILVTKMDPETRREWAKAQTEKVPPTFNQVAEFIEQQVRSLQAVGKPNRNQSKGESRPFQSHSGDRRQASSHHSSSDDTCPMCKGNHQIYQCSKFRDMTPSDRANVVKRSALCYNCLQSDHSVRDCNNKGGCKKCGKSHNTLLHFDKQHHTNNPSTSSNGSQPSNPSGSSASGSSVNSHHGSTSESSQVLLSTALVYAHDSGNQKHVCRSLLDDGSEVSFITESCVKALGLEREKTHVQINGISTSNCVAKNKVNLKLSSLVHDITINVEALIVPKVTGILPKFGMNRSEWSHLSGIALADPDFDRPGNIDILLGAEVVASVMRDGRKEGSRHTGIARNSLFGWVVSGRVATASSRSVIRVHHANVEDILHRFWELEQVPAIRHLTKEEQLCEDHFTKTHSRDANGRFIVKLPFNSNIQNIGSSREQAIIRLKQVERRLAKNPEQREAYIKFMREYQDLNHMQKIPDHLVNKNQAYYLPHHCVVKLDSTSTKLRVVFDGSAKSSTGVSINNALMVGPTIQDDLFNLLLRFRCNLVALKADIKKMYRQFNVHEDDADYQRIVWRESPDQPIRDYRLSTVTYGTASAPYLATRCLKQLAQDEEKDFPLASKALSEDMYVDDLMGGESNSTRAINLQQQITKLAKRGGMEIVKWATNDPVVLQSIPPELRECQDELTLDIDSSVKALGVKWKPAPDLYSFSVNPITHKSNITKRTLLSELAKVFDPLGLLSPTTVKAKLIFQYLWKEKCSWDEPLSDEIQQQWNFYQKQMHFIGFIKIPRCIIVANRTRQQFCGFSDASEKAYAAAVYLRSERSDGMVSVILVAAKTKVAPIKQVSLPRLELCGALLLCELIEVVKVSSKLQATVSAWTDSTIVLSWLASFPGRWKTFVANRVSKIQDSIPVENWHHVRSEDNPADLPSRGISAQELSESSQWWRGPEWLHQAVLPVSLYSSDMTSVTAEEKSKSVIVAQASVEESFINRYSLLTVLKRVTAYCLRFISNCRTKLNRQFGELTVSEITSAFQRLIKITQGEEFAAEMKMLKSSLAVPSTSRLKQLNPFLDKEGIMRVGGRLQNSDLPEGSKHQVILPSHHYFTILLIRHTHYTSLHGGLSLVLATLQRDFWILRARDSARHIIRKCVVCRRQRAVLSQQLMGSLPTARVNPSHPFQHCGVDYAGPYSIRPCKGRGKITIKCYFSVFVCLSTKAIHLEAVTELSTDGFLACFKRFVSRRGVPSDLYSDCGTNFVGADAELKAMLQSSNFNSTVTHHLADKGTSWHFNPPSAPHQGGLWEAGVKSVKYHLRRVMGITSVTLEGFQTVLCQVEACLNSRPLCALSSDPQDLDVLTPGHFLIGCPLTSVPEPDLTQLKVNRLSRWQQSQQMFQHFWRRWSAEYVTSLQQRFKWTQKRSNLQIDDLVIIKDDNLPPMKWKLGRIVALHPGADSCVRVVTVKTSSGEVKRPIAKLCPLIHNDLT